MFYITPLIRFLLSPFRILNGTGKPVYLTSFIALIPLCSPYSRETAVYPLPYLRERKFWPSISRIDDGKPVCLVKFATLM